ncbi:MAG: hypothetical protein IPL16_17640 [Ignavibacteria bacterium]|nr:hypothetical protein [Ignavibacteria bacterium]
MRFGHIEIFPKILLSQGFYLKILGFELVEIQHEKFVWMKYCGTEFLLRPGKNELKVNQYKDSNTGIVLYTNDLEKKKRNDLQGLEFREQTARMNV